MNELTLEIDSMTLPKNFNYDRLDKAARKILSDFDVLHKSKHELVMGGDGLEHVREVIGWLLKGKIAFREAFDEAVSK